MYGGFVVMSEDIRYMELALKEAKKAYALGEVPIGAVIVKNHQVIARAHNQKEKRRDVVAHAEIIAIQKASKKLHNWRLLDCVIYVTLEPCAMCASALAQARIKKVVYGLIDPHNGAIDSGVKLYRHKTNNKPPIVVGGVLAKESQKLLQQFFQKQRKRSA